MRPPPRYYACMYLCTPYMVVSVRRRQRAALTHAGALKGRQGRRKIGGAFLAAESQMLQGSCAVSRTAAKGREVDSHPGRE